MIRKDLTGETFNNWYVLYASTYGKDISTKYMCRCLLCGTEKEISGYTLKSGKSRMCRSCSAKLAQNNKYANDRIHNVYKGMYQRCYNKNSKSYKNYGARGITICDEWLSNRIAFFDWAYSNGFSDGMSIERIDNDGGYCPENCTIIPKSDQSKNRRTNIMITIKGDTKCLTDWCRQYNANKDKVKRLHDSGVAWVTALELNKNTSNNV